MTAAPEDPPTDRIYGYNYDNPDQSDIPGFRPSVQKAEAENFRRILSVCKQCSEFEDGKCKEVIRRYPGKAGLVVIGVQKRKNCPLGKWTISAGVS